MQLLHTARLTLEPLIAAHADEMFGVLSDPAIYAYENAPPHSAEALRERYTRLEARRSPDGGQQWLNWVLRLNDEPGRPLIGYVQATVGVRGAAIAYELASAWWGRGLAFEAVQAMIAELVERHAVRQLHAVLKQRNARSLRLLERLQFQPADTAQAMLHEIEPDERLMIRLIDTPMP